MSKQEKKQETLSSKSIERNGTNKTMKAMVYKEYGDQEVLQMQTVPIPVPKEHEVLIKVHSVSLNASDWENLTGQPLYTRMWGLSRPGIGILGSDISGWVVAVGEKVSTFKKGEAVFGDLMEIWGGFGAYLCAPAKAISRKPIDLPFNKAAAIPQSATIAYQALHYRENWLKGKSVLINGAGGGAGSFAIQIAKLKGAKVTAVDHPSKIKFMKDLGADHTVDYTKSKFTELGKTYDLIVDFVAAHSIKAYRKALSPDGLYVLIGGSLNNIFQTLFKGSFYSLFSKKKMKILAAKPNKNLTEIIDLIHENKLKVCIDKEFQFNQIPQAMQYLGKGHAKGKVVINYE